MGELAKNEYSLNTGSTLFPLTYGPKRRYVICLTVELDESLSYSTLQKAVDQAVENYGLFATRLDLSGKWPTLVPANLAVEQGNGRLVFKDIMKLNPEYHCSRIILQGQKIHLVYFHAITDGNIGIFFLQNILDNYYQLEQGISVFQNGIRHHLMRQFLLQDAYLRFGRRQKKERALKLSRRSYVLEGKQTGVLHKDVLRVDMNSFKALSKAHHATVTEMGLALIMLSLRRIKLAGGTSKRPIRISMPVDLRSLYGTQSMGNFVMSTTLEAATLYQDGAVEPTLDELCKHLHDQVAPARKPDFFLHRMYASAKLTNNSFLGTTSAKSKRNFIKNIFPYVETGTTMTVSNLGLIKAQGEGKDHLRSMDICFTPKPKSPCAVAILSLENEMVVTLVRDFDDTRPARYLSEYLTQYGCNHVLELDT